jgi:hypothetical protein
MGKVTPRSNGVNVFSFEFGIDPDPMPADINNEVIIWGSVRYAAASFRTAC